MGDRKEPRPVPTNQIRPEPPPAPPRKRTDSCANCDHLSAAGHASILAIVRSVESENARLKAECERLRYIVDAASGRRA